MHITYHNLLAAEVGIISSAACICKTSIFWEFSLEKQQTLYCGTLNDPTDFVVKVQEWNHSTCKSYPIGIGTFVYIWKGLVRAHWITS